MSVFKTISVKTQVRRLKYFSVCISFLKRNGIKKNILYSKISNWAKENKYDFDNYGASSGEITSQRKLPSKSLLNYLEGFSKLHIIDAIDDLVIPTKLSVAIKLLKRLLDEDTNTTANQFQLSEFEKLFSLYLISNNDSTIFFTILITLYKVDEEINLNFFRNHYKEIYLKNLELVLSKASSREKIQITDAIQRVKNWKNIERYVEDLVPPRVNWMYDIGVLDKDKFTQNVYELNKKGKSLANSICGQAEPIVDDNLLFNNQFEFYSKVLKRKLDDWNNLSFETKKDLLKELFYFALKDFSKVKIPRLSIEQTFFFFSSYLLLKKNILVEFSDLENFIGQEINIGNKKIGLRKAARKSESYIFIQ